MLKNGFSKRGHVIRGLLRTSRPVGLISGKLAAIFLWKALMASVSSRPAACRRAIPFSCLASKLFAAAARPIKVRASCSVTPSLFMT